MTWCAGRELAARLATRRRWQRRRNKCGGAPQAVSCPAVIVDTSVVVAGLLTKQDPSPVARILDSMLGAAFPFVLSEALLAECHAVLARPALRKLHGLTVAEVDAILTHLAQHAIVLAPVAAPPAPDPGGQLLRELLASPIDRTAA